MNDFDRGHKQGVFESLCLAVHAQEKGLDVIRQLERYVNTIARREAEEAEESE